jgi:integrase
MPSTRRHRTLPAGITLIRLPSSGESRYRLQIGPRGGRRSRLFPGNPAGLTAAIALRDEWRQRGLPVHGAPTPRGDVIATVDDGLRHRILDLEGRGKSGAVSEHIRSFLRKHAPQIATMPLHAVTVGTITEYRDRRFQIPTERTQARCADNTVSRELKELRAMMKKVREDFKVPAHIFPQENNLRVRVLTPDQYESVFPYLRQHYGPVFAEMSELALLAVLRQADVRLLQRSHVRLNEKLLLLPRTKGGPRAVRLSDRAVALLTRALARSPQGSPYVFSNPRNGKVYSANHVSRCWRKAARAVGLRDFTFHDLRHHGPTIAVNAGASVPVLQQLGGWKSAKMIERYASVMNNTLDHFLNQLGPSQPGGSR